MNYYQCRYKFAPANFFIGRLLILWHR